MPTAKRIPLILGTVLLLLACDLSAPQSNPTPVILVPTAQINGEPSPTVAFEDKETSTPEPDLPVPPFPQYDLTVSLDYENHTIQVQETILYPNHSGEAIQELVLIAEMGGYVNALKVEEIQLDSEPVTAFELNYARLTIPLAQPLEPEQSLTLSAAYTLTLPNIKGPLGYTDLQANFHNWYFFFPPYQNGTGWLVHPPGAVGEHLVYPTADFTVEIASNDPDIQVVGPEMVEATEDTYHFQLVGARAFMWSASPNWVRLEDSVSGIPVLVYVYPEHIEPGEYLLENLVEALALYQDLLGPYPFQTLTVIEFDSPDAMESDALFFLDYIYFRDFDDDARGYLVGIGVHEVCHNWWYSQVGNDQALEPWLDESLSIYCELLFYQHAHSGLVNWWWQFRIDRFEPVGYVDSSIYDHTDFMRYVGAVYMRGVQFLHQLRTLIGDAAFFGALRDYAKQGKGKIMTGEDFFRILGEHTDKDISPLLEEYFSP